MKLSISVMSKAGVYLCKACLLFLPLVYAGFLVWQEWQFRESLDSVLPIAAAIATPPVHKLLDGEAVATVLGLTPEAARALSVEPMSLQASFVLDTGLSKALLADSQGSRLYQVGDRLPGGSVLRRVEVNQVVLWNKGREELLTLRAPVAPLLRPVDSRTEPQTPAISKRYLRPLTGPSE